jgi:hypothetical protein
VLRDFDNTPMPNEEFTVTLQNGQVLSGRTDQRGYWRFDGVPAGSGEVTFTRIPESNDTEERATGGTSVT